MADQWCSIIPPYMLDELASRGTKVEAAGARRTLEHDEHMRAQRNPAAPTVRASAAARSLPTRDDGAGPLRTICDAKHSEKLPGAVVRAEGARAVKDVSVNEAYDGLGDTWKLFHEVFARDSIDGQGLGLIGTVHYGKDYDNAFWDGDQMVFGDGDGKIFGRFTASVDVIGHELAHGVTQYTAALAYDGQSGALNESMSDVFGAMVKQYALGQDAKDADWLIGAELLAPGIEGRALRDMMNPGTAYDDPKLGADPQPASMADYVTTASDNGGVHINSGIPNRAFALAAVALGGKSWEGVGQVWYDVLTGDKIQARCDFATFAKLTLDAAKERFGATSSEVKAITDAWKSVGVVPGAKKKPTKTRKPKKATPTATTPVTVQRSGGFAGITKTRDTTLGELPELDQYRWQTLLASDDLHTLAVHGQHPDEFCYRVASEPLDVDVTVGEKALPKPVKELFQRTLEQ